MTNLTNVTSVVDTAQSYIYTVAIGLVILLIGFALGILTKKLILKILKEVELNKIMSRVGIKHDLEGGISSIVMYLIYLATIIIFLDHFKIGSIVLYIILGALLMLLILTLLVGLKDVIPNFMAWLILQKRGNIKVGKKIDVKEISGEVEKIGFLETEIKTDSGDVLYVPNNLFLKSKFKLRR